MARRSRFFIGFPVFVNGKILGRDRGVSFYDILNLSKTFADRKGAESRETEKHSVSRTANAHCPKSSSDGRVMASVIGCRFKSCFLDFN